MTKKELVKRIADEVRLPQRIVANVFEAFCQNIMESVLKDEPVTIRGFGTFGKVYRKQRRGRNIKNGEMIVIPSSCIPRFDPSKEFREMITNDKI